jgi:nucleoside permease NupC
MNVWKELNLRKTMDGMKIVNNEFMKLLNLKKIEISIDKK